MSSKTNNDNEDPDENQLARNAKKPVRTFTSKVSNKGNNGTRKAKNKNSNATGSAKVDPGPLKVETSKLATLTPETGPVKVDPVPVKVATPTPENGPVKVETPTPETGTLTVEASAPETGKKKRSAKKKPELSPESVNATFEIGTEKNTTSKVEAPKVEAPKVPIDKYKKMFTDIAQIITDMKTSSTTNNNAVFKETFEKIAEIIKLDS